MRAFSLSTICLFLWGLAGSALAADTRQVIQDCEQCHGDGGGSRHASSPVIGGMSAFYLEEQLLAYQDERRPCVDSEYPEGPRKGQTTDMCKAVEGLGKGQVTEIAEYFAGKPFVPPEQSTDAAMVKQGHDLHQAHCSKCHSEGGGLAFDDAGILAGQWREYLQSTMQHYRSGDRWMPEKMKPKIEQLSDADVKALVEFYVSQEPVE